VLCRGVELVRHAQQVGQALDDDVQRLSPLSHDHINLLGHYQLSTIDLERDQLRPLRDPSIEDLPSRSSKA
jgi:hypothetical protein